MSISYSYLSAYNFARDTLTVKLITAIEKASLKISLVSSKSVGCGLGNQTMKFAQLGWEAVGIDVAPELIQFAREVDLKQEFRLRIF